MGKTLTIRLSENLDKWLEDTSRLTGISKGSIVKMQLERAREAPAHPFLEMAGTSSGPANLSTRQGFSRS